MSSVTRIYIASVHPDLVKKKTQPTILSEGITRWHKGGFWATLTEQFWSQIRAEFPSHSIQVLQSPTYKQGQTQYTIHVELTLNENCLSFVT